jgi:hypothetical protein
MMGRLKSDQGQLFYEFRLGDAVPEDHMVRKIAGRSQTKPFWIYIDVRKRASAAIAVKKCVLGGGDDRGEFRYETNRQVGI